MQFSIIALFAFMATGAVADLHSSAYCVDIEPATSFKQGQVDTENNSATGLACSAYRARNTGTNQWDTCPDCSTTVGSNGVASCISPAKHIGGDEWEYYCKQNGADGGKA
ncbi:hypothetical protein N0V82_005345 [Gnomoniopsis sp. IMI 355080]|nr:hypothetical protein N0V82_005345 [Gnomoniopsis sp. IMI 355080]